MKKTLSPLKLVTIEICFYIFPLEYQYFEQKIYTKILLKI